MVTITATDACGNSTSQSFTITVADTEAPAFVEALPADATVECDAVPAADVLTATDNCDAVSVSFTEDIASGACTNSYTVTRTWSATDCSGNVTSHTQVLTVQDTTAPAFTFVPADYTAECDAALTLDAAAATDNCGSVAWTLSEVTAAGACANAYTLTRTWTATDECGNTASATQVITVEDTTAPAFTFVPAGYTAECDAALPVETATASDNCGAVTIDMVETTEAGACANA